MTKKILIVDDEPYMRLLIEQTLEDLEDEGVELLTAEDGEDALEQVKSEQPNLVFLDLMMPKMSGFDVCNQIKNVLCMNDVYVIMLTAKGQEFDKQKGKEVGTDMYLTKPFDPDQVLEKSQEILGITATS
ncbi:MAG: response regulator [Moorea sp. SIO4G2]|uniref:Two-component system response regulator n=1 Tax=Moorena bouillonii PNG TaxID=568701 RepID=A0A1U7N812_9CYAN|nr:MULTISPECIES: response regulator [Moorena]NEO17171.1 response regulator [Moorena sp. SIO3E8]NEO61863.1 response regulator [Moorena sp. SIO4G2]NEQ03723.1 response regulator [Moorena sp. SIO3F7]OLT62090.1 two-component system response regulator [Moorena bouillonii PNG]